MKKKIHTKVFGISGLARYASQQSYSISTYLIKKAIKDGQLPCRIVGKAYLITWENFEKWISSPQNGVFVSILPLPIDRLATTPRQ